MKWTSTTHPLPSLHYLCVSMKERCSPLYCVTCCYFFFLIISLPVFHSFCFSPPPRANAHTRMYTWLQHRHTKHSQEKKNLELNSSETPRPQTDAMQLSVMHGKKRREYRWYTFDPTKTFYPRLLHMLKGLVGDQPLTAEQEAKIQDLQDEIDEIWNRRGDYKIDDEAWKTMPLFMENITEEDVEKNENCAALASIVYDGVPPEEIAENRKVQGNKAIAMALDPNQVNKENLARAAYHCYTEGIMAQCSNHVLNSQLYANRSLAHFIMQNYGHGLQDGQRAVILNPSYHKAYYRAAKCAEKIRKYDVALNLLSKAKQVDPAPEGSQLTEIVTLEELCNKGLVAAQQKQKSDGQKVRAAAAETSNILRAITSKGIKVNRTKPEVTSEQMTQYTRGQSSALPYFDVDGLLHTPVLFMYDEYQQTDYMQDVPVDTLITDLIEEMLPFPWDDRGRYATVDDVIVVYKIDDGVQMPKYFRVKDPACLLLEVLRQETYEMPGLMPVFHIISRHSEHLLKEWDIQL